MRRINNINTEALSKKKFELNYDAIAIGAIVAILSTGIGAGAYGVNHSVNNTYFKDKVGAIQISNSQDQKYNLENLYVLKKDGQLYLCYSQKISREESTSIGLKITGIIGTNGLGLPVGPFIIGLKSNTYTGLYNIEDNELVTIADHLGENYNNDALDMYDIEKVSVTVYKELRDNLGFDTSKQEINQYFDASAPKEMSAEELLNQFNFNDKSNTK